MFTSIFKGFFPTNPAIVTSGTIGQALRHDLTDATSNTASTPSLKGGINSRSSLHNIVKGTSSQPSMKEESWSLKNILRAPAVSTREETSLHKAIWTYKTQMYIEKAKATFHNLAVQVTSLATSLFRPRTVEASQSTSIPSPTLLEPAGVNAKKIQEMFKRFDHRHTPQQAPSDEQVHYFTRSEIAEALDTAPERQSDSGDADNCTGLFLREPTLAKAFQVIREKKAAIGKAAIHGHSPGLESFPHIPGYTILRTLGTGGSAKVYLAQKQDEKKTLVAIKIFHGVVGGNINHEFKMTQIGGPIIKGLEIITSSTGQPGIVFEYIHGPTLKEYIHRLHALRTTYIRFNTLEGQRNAEHMLRTILLKTVRAFSFLHDQKLVYVDIKPENIMVTDTIRAELKLIDMAATNSPQKQGEHTPFTLDYIPPERLVMITPEGYSHFHVEGANMELRKGLPDLLIGREHELAQNFNKLVKVSQGRGRPASYRLFAPRDERSDVYSLGKVLSEILTGFIAPADKCFTLASPDILKKYCEGWNLPERVVEIIWKATEINPQDRYASASELLADLEAALRQRLSPRKRDRPQPPPPRTTSSRLSRTHGIQLN